MDHAASSPARFQPALPYDRRPCRARQDNSRPVTFPARVPSIQYRPVASWTHAGGDPALLLATVGVLLLTDTAALHLATSVSTLDDDARAA